MNALLVTTDADDKAIYTLALALTRAGDAVARWNKTTRPGSRIYRHGQRGTTMGRHMEKAGTEHAVICLDCDRRIHLSAKARLGDFVACPNCDSEFEVVGLKPARIKWVYDDLSMYDDFDDESGDQLAMALERF